MFSFKNREAMEIEINVLPMRPSCISPLALGIKSTLPGLWFKMRRRLELKRKEGIKYFPAITNSNTMTHWGSPLK